MIITTSRHNFIRNNPSKVVTTPRFNHSFRSLDDDDDREETNVERISKKIILNFMIFLVVLTLSLRSYQEKTDAFEEENLKEQIEIANDFAVVDLANLIVNPKSVKVISKETNLQDPNIANEVQGFKSIIDNFMKSDKVVANSLSKLLDKNYNSFRNLIRTYSRMNSPQEKELLLKQFVSQSLKQPVNSPQIIEIAAKFKSILDDLQCNIQDLNKNFEKSRKQ